MNTPKWQDFCKDLRVRKPHTESMHIQLRGTDLAHLPFAGKIKWMIEFPPAWKWFVAWSPGLIPQHFKESSSMPGPSHRAWRVLQLHLVAALAAFHLQQREGQRQHQSHVRSLLTSRQGSQHQHLQCRLSRISGCSRVHRQLCSMWTI